MNRKRQDEPLLIRYIDRVRGTEWRPDKMEWLTCIRTAIDYMEEHNYPDIPIILVTHSSEEAIKENMEFDGTGNSCRERE